MDRALAIPDLTLSVDDGEIDLAVDALDTGVTWEHQSGASEALVPTGDIVPVATGTTDSIEGANGTAIYVRARRRRGDTVGRWSGIDSAIPNANAPKLGVLAGLTATPESASISLVRPRARCLPTRRGGYCA